MYISFELFFFWRKCSMVVAVGVQTSFLPFAKSVTEKNNSRVDCAEADKKTVQAQRNEGRGFLAAGDFFTRIPATLGIAQTSLALHSLARYLHCGAARNLLSGET
jgi:hypothetical protein